jgi:hypothetical protein
MERHMTSIPADPTILRGRVPGESGLLDPEVPAIAHARRRAAERRFADFGITPRRPARAVVIHISGDDVLPANA